MTYLTIKRIKGNPYLYEVRSVREGDRVRQVFVRYLGRADRASATERRTVVPEAVSVEPEVMAVETEIVMPEVAEPNLERFKQGLITRDEYLSAEGLTDISYKTEVDTMLGMVDKKQYSKLRNYVNQLELDDEFARDEIIDWIGEVRQLTESPPFRLADLTEGMEALRESIKGVYPPISKAIPKAEVSPATPEVTPTLVKPTTVKPAIAKPVTPEVTPPPTEEDAEEEPEDTEQA